MSEKFAPDSRLTGLRETFVHRMNACQPNVNTVAKYLVYYLARRLAYEIRIVDRRNIKYSFKTLSIFSEKFKST